jgi:hypothetical protein
MPKEFLTFQQFNDAELAKELGQRLEEGGIEYRSEDNRKFFDPSFANNTLQYDIDIKVREDDFERANKVLGDFYQKSLENVEDDYYLLKFSDDELTEIVSKPDEWGHFDYQLAKKLLKDRGKEVNHEIAEQLKEQRIKELTKPEKTDWVWLYLGYSSAILGGIFGIVIGCAIAYLRKTLPNGQRIYVYEDNQRNHGIKMILISCVSIFFWLFIKWKYFDSN